MRPRVVLLIAIATVSLFGLAYALRQLSFISVGLATNSETQSQLRKSLDDQKKLRQLDPSNASTYRRRFEEIRTLVNRVEILALSRQVLTRRFEVVLLAIVGVIIVSAATAFLLEQRSRDARHQKRVRYLEHLSAWQEAARRHAHEIRTPLTAAQMEVGRLVRTMSQRTPEAEEELRQAEASILEELEQLRDFTQNFVSFAKVGEPQLRPHDVNRLLGEFCTTFAPNWPDMSLQLDRAGGDCHAALDRDMIRQVLVNLCSNSAQASATTVRFSVRSSSGNVIVDVSDNGSGVPPEIRRHIFEPYVTTRKIGEGMGLGLAISRKILLDHGGDLELVNGAPTVFRLTFPESHP